MTYTYNDAMTMIASGAKMYRTGWKRPGMWIELSFSTETQEAQAYIYFSPTKCVPWRNTAEDKAATDWKVKE